MKATPVIHAGNFQKGRDWAAAAGLALLINLLLFAALPAVKLPPAPAAEPYRQPGPVTVTRLRPSRPLPAPAPLVKPSVPEKKPEATAPARSVPAVKKVPAVSPEPVETTRPDSGAETTPEAPPVPAGPQVFDAMDLDSPLVPVFRKPPVYPAHAKRRNIQGWVTVSFLVDAKGRVTDVTVTESDPESIFDDSVIQCVSGWRFKPGTIAGRPVVTKVTTTIRFELKADE
ncbi:energy transducer TonB [Desulfosudis oleivorans]|uniref:TonB family protein n=1 Tax=Desulfosudis oleivorans (strain DSM 6200 / JCM 39069 / Hxd3) TaxID=96561 RepID=A9A0R4_DESOH|nr:energy transducer TonB [Desulfosudis oleivorans]ABW67539.1 TonB family protein [Desulfosudis oleivorans Hxd3]